MKTTRPYRKFDLQQEKIEKLEKDSSRFKRIYSEYTNMSEELWTLETSEGISIPDDFINSIKLQTSYLEDEIQDFLMQNEEEPS